MLEFSEKVAGDAWNITEEDVQNLRKAGFSEVEILEIVAAACYRVYISKFADALGVELDDRYFQDSPELVKALSMGRPALRGKTGNRPAEESEATPPSK